MRLIPILLVALSLLELSLCFQTCIVDFVKKLLAPKQPSETLPVEHRLALMNRIQNAVKTSRNTFNEKRLLHNVPIIKNGVDVLMEGSTTTKPEELSLTTTAQNDNRIRNNITVIARSQVDVITEEEEPDTQLNEDLLDSFGGMEGENNFEEGESPKNGMYFLLDWNTFLEVDDQKGSSVNLRVQPKVGDAKQFLDVTVP